MQQLIPAIIAVGVFVYFLLKKPKKKGSIDPIRGWLR